MNCREFRNVLSPYLDGELSAAERSKAREHLLICSRCAAETDRQKSISRYYRLLPDPEPPTNLWDRLQRRANSAAADLRLAVSAAEAESETDTDPSPRSSRWPLRWYCVTTLIILLIIGLGVLFHSLNHADHHTVDLADYLSSFSKSPADAQSRLLTTYRHRAVTDVKEAKRLLGYTPAVADGLPEGVTLRKLHVIDMPCCTCAQAECEVDGRDTVVLFEHDREDSFRFGRRVSVACSCCGCRTQLIPFDGHLVASWERGSRYLTLIGARDLSQVLRFVEKLR